MPRTTCIQTWPGVVRAVPINDSTLMHLHSNCKSEYTCWEERYTSRAGQERDTPKAVAHLCWNCSTWARSSISAFLKQLDLCPQMGVYMLGGTGYIESGSKHACVSNCSTWAHSSLSAFLKQLELSFPYYFRAPPKQLQIGVYMLGGTAYIESGAKAHLC